LNLNKKEGCTGRWQQVKKQKEKNPMSEEYISRLFFLVNDFSIIANQSTVSDF